MAFRLAGDLRGMSCGAMLHMMITRCGSSRPCMMWTCRRDRANRLRAETSPGWPARWATPCQPSPGSYGSCARLIPDVVRRNAAAAGPLWVRRGPPGLPGLLGAGQDPAGLREKSPGGCSILCVARSLRVGTPLPRLPVAQAVIRVLRSSPKLDAAKGSRGLPRAGTPISPRPRRQGCGRTLPSHQEPVGVPELVARRYQGSPAAPDSSLRSGSTSSGCPSLANPPSRTAASALHAPPPEPATLSLRSISRTPYRIPWWGNVGGFRMSAFDARGPSHCGDQRVTDPVCGVGIAFLVGPADPPAC